MKQLVLFTFSFLTLSLGVFGQEILSKKEQKKLKKNYLLDDRNWTVEVPLWIPGFAGDFSYGDIILEGEDGGDPGDPSDPGDDNKPGWIDRVFTKEWYLKFFFLTKIAYEKGRFSAQLDGITGAVGASVKFNYNNKQIVQANFRTINARLYAGYKFVNMNSKSKKFRYELFGYLGTRTHFQKVYSDLDGLLNKLDINLQWTEPIIGIQNQFTFKRWMFIIQGDYGGLFVSNKWSDQFTFTCFYRSGKFTSIKIGWNRLDLNHRDILGPEEVRLTFRFSGPSLGLAFNF